MPVKISQSHKSHSCLWEDIFIIDTQNNFVNWREIIWSTTTKKHNWTYNKNKISKLCNIIVLSVANVPIRNWKTSTLDQYKTLFTFCQSKLPIVHKNAMTEEKRTHTHTHTRPHAREIFSLDRRLFFVGWCVPISDVVPQFPISSLQALWGRGTV